MKKVVFLLLICTFLITGCSVKKADEVTDAEIFASEYAISKDNVFKYATLDEVLTLLDNGTGIIFFGNSDQEDSLNIVKMFSNLVEKKGITEVYYYNPIVIRDNSTDDYNRLTELLGGNVTITEEGDSYLEVPSVYFIREGEIIGYNDDASRMYETDEETSVDLEEFLEEKYIELIDKYLGEENID